MKIGVSTYGFNGLFKKGELTEIEMVYKAKEMGFNVVEIFDGYPTPEGETEMSQAEKIKNAAIDAGIEMGNYTVAGDLINGCEGDLDAEVERLKSHVDIAEMLGSPGMRHDAGWGMTPDKAYKGFAGYLEHMADGCRRITQYAAEKGIATMVENHGYFAQDSTRVESLVTCVNNPNFGVLIDMGNFLCVDENPQTAVGRLLPYAKHVHAKDFHVKSGMEPNPGAGWFPTRGGNYLRGAIIGHGNVPILACLKAMQKAGYQNVLSIEFEGMEDNEFALNTGLSNLRHYCEMAGL